MDWDFPENWKIHEEGTAPFIILLHDTTEDMCLLKLTTHKWATCAIIEEKGSTINFVCKLNKLSAMLINSVSTIYQLKPDNRVELHIRAVGSRVSAISSNDTHFPKISCDKNDNFVFSMGQYKEDLQEEHSLSVDPILDILQHVLCNEVFGVNLSLTDDGTYEFSVHVLEEESQEEIALRHKTISDHIKRYIDNYTDNKIKFSVKVIPDKKCSPITTKQARIPIEDDTFEEWGKPWTPDQDKNDSM